MNIDRNQFDNNWDAIFNGKPNEKMFDHMMIDKILVSEVEKLVPDDEVAVPKPGKKESLRPNITFLTG